MMKADKRGFDLLHNPSLNKSTAFTKSEREKLGLVGLLPPGVESMDQQVGRVLDRFDRAKTDLERYLCLSETLDENETLYYKTVMSDPARFLPIVYTPTIGEVCQNFGQIFKRPRGLYVSLKDRGRVKDVLRNWPVQDIRVVCVSSGGRILGLGDLGANGMGIPIGKLQLYTVCAAVPPQHLLPVLFDFGTNNSDLLDDPRYLGLRQRRIEVGEADEFLDEFIEAAQEVFPGCCIHFEDWAGTDAIRLLDSYREKICCYNDDIQGTGAVVVAGLTNALRVVGGRMRDQRFLFMGAGSAGIGIADMIVSAMTLEGLDKDQARERISLFDSHGLVVSGREKMHNFQRPYAHPHEPLRDFTAVIEALKPTAIIGVSTQAKAFTKKVIEAMARLHSRPIIFALSNPTSKAECTAEEAYGWSEGRALFAAGVPFKSIQWGGRTIVPGQCNNMYVFPALGLALVATKARRVTDEMFITAARAVASQVTPSELESGLLYPPQSNILQTEVETAIQIAEVIFARDLAGVPKPSNVRDFIESQMYQPDYENFV
jgi:malate dehydrogenase (oxaloacetate-decarboxylating)(NADP+)